MNKISKNNPEIKIVQYKNVIIQKILTKIIRLNSPLFHPCHHPQKSKLTKQVLNLNQIFGLNQKI